jgi:hypothetical protein
MARARLGRSGNVDEVLIAPGTLTVAALFGKLIVTLPVRSNVALPSTLMAWPFVLAAVTPQPFTAEPMTPRPNELPVASSPTTPPRWCRKRFR